ncbi:metal-sensitive transcriptional regulator [Streptomyces sp. NPDC017936]|uniref:metal-sensitive transcriptional regulator n=1 Tax=Streptomyces sp. NPDC017936 TaxID=3365016 RepID=UPI00378F3C03
MVSCSHHEEDVLKRLRRIGGQVRGLRRMVEEDTYCIDVLTQVSATTRAPRSFALQMLDGHMDTCVRTAVAEGGEDGDLKLKEARDAIARLVRSWPLLDHARGGRGAAENPCTVGPADRAAPRPWR